MNTRDAGDLWRQAAVSVDARRASGIVAAVAMCFYGFFAVMHWAVLEGDARMIMTVTAAASASIGLLMLILIRTAGFKGEFLVNTVLAMVAINTLLHMAVTGDARQTSNVVLVIVALGFFVLRRTHAAVAIVAVVATWALLVPGGTETYLHYGFSVGSAVVLAVIVGWIRRRLLFAATRAAHAWANSQEDEESPAQERLAPRSWQG